MKKEITVARKTTAERRADMLAQMDAIKKELTELDTKAGERIGKLAIKAGLTELHLDDETLLKEFQAIASRFQGKHKEPKQSVKTPADPA